MNTTTELLQISGGELKNRKSVYESGKRTVYSVFNEVVDASYDRLAGAISNFVDEEKNKAMPNHELITYCNQICQALWQEKSFFGKFTDEEIEIIATNMSPITKGFLTLSEHEHHSLIEQNKPYFDNLIQRWG